MVSVSVLEDWRLCTRQPSYRMATARDQLSKPEVVGESIYQLMRIGALTKEQFCSRMAALDATPESALGSVYATWLILRAKPPSAEKEFHMDALKARMREIVRYQEEEAHDALIK